MIFSVYVLREDPDYAIFDTQLGNPPLVGSESSDYDCAAVFECEDNRARIVTDAEKGPFVGVISERPWRLFPPALLCGDFTDREVNIDAPIKCLWPST